MSSNIGSFLGGFAMNDFKNDKNSPRDQRTISPRWQSDPRIPPGIQEARPIPRGTQGHPTGQRHLPAPGSGILQHAARRPLLLLIFR